MNFHAMPRCSSARLPPLPAFPPASQLPNSTTSAIPYGGLSPSPDGVFTPLNPTRSSVPSPPQAAVEQPQLEPGVVLLEPHNTKRKLKPSPQGEEKVMKGVEEKKAKRAEKNRKFAKESRDRKRKYVQDLEAEVKYLREQLDIHKQNLRKYELIEKHSGAIGRDTYYTMIDVYQEMYKSNQSLADHSAFIETLRKKVGETFEELKGVLIQLTKAMMTVILPLPLRISIWLSEKDIDPYDCDKGLNKLEPKVPAEHVKVILAYLKELYPDKEKYCKMQAEFSDAGKKIKLLMKQIIEYQRKVQTELINYSKFVDTYIVPHSNPRLMEALAKFTPYFNCIAELSDYAIYQIKDTDIEITT
eukprot:TRINITY_DN1550_c0_g1_i5.p1 TRINITY_DN1550_c0_g1~~TRINITY_DN1550_c0_g1_i5.p1  ORF type:complete len:358 (+),score=84.16 TRINITY_DN1550_c0_g1_i5:209-1282(+)